VRKSGEVTKLAPSINHVFDFIIDDTNVYYFDEIPGTGSFGPIALKKIPKSGGEPVTLDQGQAGWIKHLAEDSNQIYFTDISGSMPWRSETQGRVKCFRSPEGWQDISRWSTRSRDHRKRGQDRSAPQRGAREVENSHGLNFFQPALSHCFLN
jgi:hypothetical protein